MIFRNIAKTVFHWWWLLRRPMTLGVRVIVISQNREVLLVRHSYVAGWYLPGGGVERGETLEEAARKEVMEEACIRADALKLQSIHYNANASPRDHVALYVCDQYEPLGEFSQTREISEIGFFSLDQLPEGATPATRRRLAEVFGNQPSSSNW